jgi:hypothetical protein
MAKLQVHRLFPMFVAVAFASAGLLATAQPADAESAALFRATRMWWFSHTDSWTDSSHPFIPSTGGKSGMEYEPPASAILSTLTAKAGFIAPKSFIKNTTYYWACPSKGFKCYDGYPESKGWYSYWNGRAQFQKSAPENATAPTTIRVRTFDDGWKNGPSSMNGPIKTTANGQNIPPTVAGTPVYSTTTWGGNYSYDRGGSIMIIPGDARFGGTMRWFGGPNAKGYQLISISDPLWFKAYSVSPPLSEQPASDLPIEVGEVKLTGSIKRYRLTNPNHQLLDVVSTTGTTGASCSPASRLASLPAGCEFYVKIGNYLITRAAYTTGHVTNWDVFGTSTFQTETGYDNRFIDPTTGGLKGVVSMVQPRLFTTYTIDPPQAPSGAAINRTWGSARLRRMDFHFLPEPAGIAMLAAGFATLAGLYRLRRR